MTTKYFHVHAVHDTQGRLHMQQTYPATADTVTALAAAERYVMNALPGCKIERIPGPDPVRIGGFHCFAASNPSYKSDPHLVIVTETEESPS